MLSRIEQILPEELAKYGKAESEKCGALLRTNPSKLDGYLASPLSWFHVDTASACDDVSLFILATLEYIMAEMVELSGNEVYQGCSSIRPGHIIVAVRNDEQLHELSIRLGLEEHFPPPAIETVYWPLPQTAERMRALDLRHSWYHQPEHMNPTSLVYQQHLTSYLEGKSGDEYYFRRFHIRPVQYLGFRRGSYETQSRRGTLAYDEDEADYYYAHFDIVDSQGISHPYHMEICPNPGSEGGYGYVGYIYCRTTCNIVATIEKWEDMDFDQNHNEYSQIIYSAESPSLSYAPWGHLLTLTEDSEESDQVYGWFWRWGIQQLPNKQSQTPNETAIHELVRLMGIAHRLAHVDDDPIHPALYTANHPMSLRITFRQHALKQALLTRMSPLAISLAHVTPLLTLIASFVPADLPYIDGVSDTVPEYDESDSSSLNQFCEPAYPSYDHVYQPA